MINKEPKAIVCTQKQSIFMVETLVMRRRGESSCSILKLFGTSNQVVSMDSVVPARCGHPLHLISESV